MAYLVCGGAGYIGSHMVNHLIESGKTVIVADNLMTGHKKAVHPKATFIEADLRDAEAMSKIFEKQGIEGVYHFAASSLVGESSVDPLKYYKNNLYGTMVLLEVMIKYGVKHLVFSSTAAVYGEPRSIPITELDETKPTNPYGETKLAMERMIEWVSKTSELKYVSLRYFNASGAHSDGKIGEAHQPETHLIPIILQVPLMKRDYISIYGSDYKTTDGTCIRDYIHVEDLIDAHQLAMNFLETEGENRIYNLGSGTGFSVKEMIDAARQITHHEIVEKVSARREGDPSTLVASSEKIKDELGWEPKKNNIMTIIEDAWRWHKNNPNGYE